jgi:hypothetical protein
VDEDELIERVRQGDIEGLEDIEGFEDAIEDAVARGVERGAENVVATAAGAYFLGGCMLMILKAAGWALLLLVFLVVTQCGGRRHGALPEAPPTIASA